MTNASNTPLSPTPHKRSHPLILAAAGGVLVMSLVATAAITGVLPLASSQSAAQLHGDSAAPATPAAPTAQQPAQQANPAPAQSAASYYGYAPRSPATTAPTSAQGAPGMAAQAAICETCGTVEAVRAIRVEGHGTGLGAVGGAVAGGVVGNQFGSGGGRTAMTLLGALGGGLAGNAVEKNLRSTTEYRVTVRMENGRYRTFTYRSAPPVQQGERVRVEHGTLVRAA